MKRREFITLVGSAVVWPAMAQAQRPATPKIGFLVAASQNQVGDYWDAFQKGLEEGGFVDGRNVTIESRFGEGRYERLPDLAADLLRNRVAVLVGAAPPAALAAKAATSTIPVVFVSGDDPVKSGLVERLNRPGANVTGVSVFSGSQLGAKQLSLLHDLVPAAAVISLLVNPANTVQTAAQIKLVEVAVHDLGLQLHVVKASSESEFDDAFANAAQQSKALVVGADPLFVAKRAQLTALAARHTIPAIYEFREYAVSGGLMSYGPSLRGGYRQAGIYVARILKGEKPGDLPIMLPTKFELVINMKAAKGLNLTVPNSMQLLADEVIE